MEIDMGLEHLEVPLKENLAVVAKHCATCTWLTPGAGNFFIDILDCPKNMTTDLVKIYMRDKSTYDFVSGVLSCLVTAKEKITCKQVIDILRQNSFNTVATEICEELLSKASNVPPASPNVLSVVSSIVETPSHVQTLPSEMPSTDPKVLERPLNALLTAPYLHPPHPYMVSTGRTPSLSTSIGVSSDTSNLVDVSADKFDEHSDSDEDISQSSNNRSIPWFGGRYQCVLIIFLMIFSCSATVIITLVVSYKFGTTEHLFGNTRTLVPPATTLQPDVQVEINRPRKNPFSPEVIINCWQDLQKLTSDTVLVKMTRFCSTIQTQPQLVFLPKVTNDNITFKLDFSKQNDSSLHPDFTITSGLIQLFSPKIDELQIYDNFCELNFSYRILPNNMPTVARLLVVVPNNDCFLNYFLSDNITFPHLVSAEFSGGESSIKKPVVFHHCKKNSDRFDTLTTIM